MKQLVKSLLTHPAVAPKAARAALRLHNLSYRLAAVFSEAIEPEGLHPKHRLMNYHAWFVSHIDPSWRVLDVGCGNGALAADLARHCRKVVGIELNPRNVERARERARRAGSTAEFIQGDATVYPFEGRFDAIVLSNVLEHIEDRVEFLHKLRAVSSRFLIRVPMIDRDWITLYKREMRVEHRLDPTHFTEYTLEQFREETAQAGLGIRPETLTIRFGEIYAVLDIQGSDGT